MMNYDYSSVTTCDNEELFAVFSKIKTNPNPYDDSAVPLLVADLFHRLHLLEGMHWWIKTGDDLAACGVDVCRSSACIDMMCSNLFLSEIDKNLLTLAGITDISSFQRIEDYLKQLPKDKVRVWNMDTDTYLKLED